MKKSSSKLAFLYMKKAQHYRVRLFFFFVGVAGLPSVILGLGE